MPSEAITLRINGAAREVKGPRDMPLLWALREQTVSRYGIADIR